MDSEITATNLESVGKRKISSSLIPKQSNRSPRKKISKKRVTTKR